MYASPPRRRMLISYAAFFLAFAATAARAVFTLRDTPGLWWMVGMLGVYLLALIAEPGLVSRDRRWLHAFNAVQAGLALALLVFIDRFDFFALLFIPPCALSVLHFPRRTALAWIAVIVLLMEAALLTQFPPQESIGYIIIYPTGIFLFCGYAYMALQAEQAQARGEVLLADLQQANRKLKIYAAQVEELAAANERSRLARELHDSVTQTIFGLTLSAQAARILMDRDPQRAAVELDHMQTLAQNSLAEMRALIQQLRPRAVSEEGLAAGLRRLAAEQQQNNGLAVDVQVRGERRLPGKVEEELYRVAQEALNNIAKHARTGTAAVALDLSAVERVLMAVEDEGAGFSPGAAHSQPGHLGLTSMRERVEALGGTLRIDSQPGKGTRVQVELAVAPDPVPATEQSAVVGAR